VGRPGLLVLAAVLGVAGESAIGPLIDNLGKRRARAGEGDRHERAAGPAEQWRRVSDSGPDVGC
jgi:hypothetical protein